MPAGTASGVHPVPLGFGRVYVHVGKDFRYDAWVKAGATGWGFEDLLPYFRRSEHAPGRDPALRGSSGPVPVAPVPEPDQHPVAAAFAGLEPDLRAWREPMTKHASEPLESACVHADAVGYGTRSSLQMLVRPGSASALWTDGHPCVNAPRDISALAGELFAAPG